MKKLFAILITIAATLLTASCQKDAPLVKDDLLGAWKLVSIDGDPVNTKSFSDSRGLSVWIQLSADSFDIYQRVGEDVSYSHFKGSWSLSDGVISGKYSDGSAWAGSYSVALDGGYMTLSCANEVQKFHKEPSLPSEILK